MGNDIVHQVSRGLGHGALPRRARRRDDFLDAHRLDAPDEMAPKMCHGHAAGSGARIVGKGLDDLLGGPPGRRRGRDVEVQDATPVVGHDEEDVEHAERDRGDHEEVDRDDVRQVVVQE